MMKKQRENFRNRLFWIVGIIAVVAVVMFVSCVPNLEQGVGHVVFAAGVVLAGVNYSGKTLVELKEFRGEVYQEYLDLKTLCETEKRDLNETEIPRRDELRKALDRIDKEIDIKAEEERMAKMYAKKQMKTENNEKRELGTYSFVKAIREFSQKMTGSGDGLTGIEAEMHQEAEKEARDMGKAISGLGVPGVIMKRAVDATGNDSIPGDTGGFTIQTTKVGFVDALRAKMVLSDLGAQFLTGLNGNVSIPKKTAVSNASWATGENSDSSQTQPYFGTIELAPKRLTSFVNISKQLIAQSSLDVENLVINDLQTAVRLALEYAAINGTGINGMPKGILQTNGIGTVIGGTNGLIPTWAKIIALESEVALDNADMGSLAYLTNPKVRGILKSTPKVMAQAQYIWGENTTPLNGYKAAVTTQVPSDLSKGTSEEVCSAIIFGNFAELIIAQWAGLDMVIDPFTLAGNNEIKITVNSLWDVAVRHPESFAAMVDALTA